MEERLQNILAHRGVASRRHSASNIEEGRVTVDGSVCTEPGARFDPEKVIVRVDGRVIAVMKERTRTIMMYKPAGVLSSVSDPFGGETVIDLIKGRIRERLVPVGRLDKDSEGLLLFTNDGALANALTHPSHQVAKMYRVTVHPAATEEQVVALANGVVLDDGTKTLPAIIRVVAEDEDRTVMEMSIKEGKNRQIRRMCRAVGLDVARLSRKSVGAVKLGMLAPGKYRELKPSEILALKAAAEKAGRKNAKKPVKDR